MEQVGLAIIGSTGAIGKTHIEAIYGLTSCRLVGLNARRLGPLCQQASKLGVHAYPTLDHVPVSYKHLRAHETGRNEVLPGSR